MNASAYQIRCKHLIRQKLPDKENGGYEQDRCPVRPELRDRDARRNNETGERAEIGDEAYQACRKADRQTVLEADQPQRKCVVYGEDQTKRALAAHESTDRVVDLAGQRSHRVAARGRDPVVDRCDHPVPIVDKVERNDRGYYSQREDREQGSSSRPDRAQECAEPAARERRKLTERTLGLA